MNMVNSLLLRIHLSGEVYGWDKERTEYVKDAVRIYKEIRGDISTSVPFYPLGIPQYDGEFMCAAYDNEKTAKMAVWRMDTDKDSIHVPLDFKVKSAKILYPVVKNGSVTVNCEGVKVTLDKKYTAAIIEIIKE